MTQYSVVMTTFESAEQSQPIIDQVLKEHLAACVQTQSITSNYFWKGEVCHDSEVLVLFKTRSDLFNKLQERLVELHPYETPELIQIPILDGYDPYLKWIDENTNQ